MEAQSQRNKFLDYLKGIAIILVVIGHCIQWTKPYYAENPVFRFIYSFHMPFFMFLAGASAKVSLLNRNRIKLRSKVVTLVLPFLSWHIVNFMLSEQEINFLQYFKKLIINVDCGLWFLWVLFLNYVTIWVFVNVYKIFKRRDAVDPKFQLCMDSIGILWIGVVFILRIILNTSIAGIGLYEWHYTWFILGFVCFRKIENLITLHKPTFYNRILILLAFLVLLIPWRWAEEPMFTGILQNLLQTPFLVFAITYAYKLLIPCIGICVALVMGNYLYDNSSTIKAITYLGKNTLGIYALHTHLIINTALLGTFLFDVVGKSVIAITLSLLLIIIIGNSKILSFFLLGKK